MTSFRGTRSEKIIRSEKDSPWWGPKTKAMALDLKPTRSETMFLNMGPSHPAMHCIVRILIELDGETVVNSDVEIGFLHRAFEKMAEQGGYWQVVPYTDRLNYVSPLINNFGYASAVEKLFGIDITERTKYIRVIMSEISRVADHLTCVGATAMEMGAFTVFLYMIKAREYLYELVEDVTGARVTVSYARIGGVKSDLPEGFKEKTLTALKETRKVLKEVNGLITRNRIFVDRMKGIGVISKEDALSYGITGPFLRSTGVDYDVRKDQSYYVYDRFDFDVPVGEKGDNYDRYLLRMEEMEQSMRIIEQGLEQIPAGEINVDMEGRAIPASQMVDEAKMGRSSDLKRWSKACASSSRGLSKSRPVKSMWTWKAARFRPRKWWMRRKWGAPPDWFSSKWRPTPRSKALPNAFTTIFTLAAKNWPCRPRKTLTATSKA